MWIWIRKQIREGFPQGFRTQRIGITSAQTLSDLPASQIPAYLREHPEIAEALLDESRDKRFTPSSFLAQNGGGFRVGWLTRDARYECVRDFSKLEDAAADYVLFSLGEGRWNAATHEVESGESQ